MVPPTSYVMQPDGSSGYSVATGDDIPNIDPVRKMIRGYYNADSSGIANKVTSPYITQLHLAAVDLDAAGDQRLPTDGHGVQRRDWRSRPPRRRRSPRTRRRSRRRGRRSAKAKTPAARKRAHQKLDKARKALKKDKAALAAITLPAQPAVVFDADDTTLWTYDMEDGAMKFIFDPVLQDTWVQPQQFPADPGMVGVVERPPQPPAARSSA